MERRIILVSALAAFAFASAARAAVINNRDALINHLKIAGYEVEPRDNESVLVKSRTEANFVIRGTDEGLLFRAFFGGSSKAKSNRSGFINFVNTLNEKAMLVRYYVDSDTDLAIEALFPGDYDQRLFTIFLNSWRKDQVRLASTTGVTEWIK